MALKKMYADMEAEVIRELMKEINRHSLKTLLLWSCTLLKETVLPLLEEEEYADLLRMTEAYSECEDAKKAKLMLKELKAAIALLRKDAAGRKDPVQQAAARSITTGAAIASTVTNALGYLLYACMAHAYAVCGIKAAEGEILSTAENYLQEALKQLQAVQEKEDAKLVKADFNC